MDLNQPIKLSRKEWVVLAVQLGIAVGFSGWVLERYGTLAALCSLGVCVAVIAVGVTRRTPPTD